MSADPLLIGDKDATIGRLWAEREKLIERLHQYELMEMSPPPRAEDDDPGYQTWWALMEDLREEGVRRLNVTVVTHVGFSYEPRAILSRVAGPVEDTK